MELSLRLRLPGFWGSTWCIFLSNYFFCGEKLKQAVISLCWDWCYWQFLRNYCHTWPQLTTQLDPASAGQLGHEVALLLPTRPAVRQQNFKTHIITIQSLQNELGTMKYTLYWLCLTISPIFNLSENLKVLNSSKSHAMLKSTTWNPKSNIILTLAYWLTNCILSDNWEFRCGPAQPQLVFLP